MSNATKIKIFLSSTFTDLSGIRARISQWLSGLFGTELIIMESMKLLRGKEIEYICVQSGAGNYYQGKIPKSVKEKLRDTEG